MKWKILILLAIAALLTMLCSGCQTYKEQVWTPDGINYTYARDRKTGDECDYVGLSWSLKP